MKKILKSLFSAFIIGISLLSCKKWVQVDPPNNALSRNNIFTDNGTAASTLTGIYSNMSGDNYAFVTGSNSISVKCGLSADELTLFGGSAANQTLQIYYRNNLSSSSNGLFWNPFYQTLLQINSSIAGLQGSTGLTPAVKTQLLGEALFLRGFVNFYLVTLYGKAPLVLSANYQLNSTIPSASSSQIWQQIHTDLTDASKLLSDVYLDGTVINSTTERVRPTRWAAYALLSRSYLFSGNWDSAEIAATIVINNSSLFGLDSLNDTFLKNSMESIWQLQPVHDGQNTMDANTFILISGPNTSNKPVYLSSFLLNAFEPGDERFTDWVALDSSTGENFYYPFKYKNSTYNSGSPVTEYLMVLRLSEQYLIRAEARCEKNNLAGAISDLNMIRNRAGLPNTNAISQAEILKAIQHERQVELFTEWGTRWLDLKRTGSVDSVMSAVTPKKGGMWDTNWQLYPVPIYDIQHNSNISQNPGY